MGTVRTRRCYPSVSHTPADTPQDGPGCSPAPGSFLGGWRLSIRMNAFNQLASAALVLIFAAAMWMVGKSYAESQASKTFVVPAKLVMQAR